MSDRDRGVPRGDNVPAGEREENEQRSEHRATAGEKRRDDVDVEPGHANQGPRGSDAWGSEPSGGSVIDKR
ncbi:MAG TPA: hypothetical protein VFY85_10375 [Gemmatimonadaceae bacterium]|nr:hypothetical protein [Gemmatimonadaceae bacterium]